MPKLKILDFDIKVKCCTENLLENFIKRIINKKLNLINIRINGKIIDIIKYNKLKNIEEDQKLNIENGKLVRSNNNNIINIDLNKENKIMKFALFIIIVLSFLHLLYKLR